MRRSAASTALLLMGRWRERALGNTYGGASGLTIPPPVNGSRSRDETAHRVMQNCGQVFRYAVATGRAERDPTADLRGALPPPKEKHHASIIEPKRIGELLRAIEGGSFPRKAWTMPERHTRKNPLLSVGFRTSSVSLGKVESGPDRKASEPLLRSRSRLRSSRPSRRRSISRSPARPLGFRGWV